LVATADNCRQLESELATVQRQELEAGQKWHSLRAELTVSEGQITKLEEEAKQSAEQMLLATQKIKHLQSELDAKTKQQQDNALTVAGLLAEKPVYEAELARLKQVHEQTLQELDSAKQKIAWLEERLRGLATQPENNKPEPAVQEPQPIAQAAEDTQPTGLLLSRFFKNITADLHLSKQPPEPRQTTAPTDSILLAEKDAMIENLKAELSAQQNTIAWLEREIEAKQKQTQKKASDEGVTASPSDAQPSNQTALNLAKKWLAQLKPSPTNKPLENVTHPPEETKPQPAKPLTDKQDATTDKAKQIPDRIKSLLQKITPFKG